MAEKYLSLLEKCELCPRRCGVNRLGDKGFCGGGRYARVALVSLHPWEEPVIAGPKQAAGTVFFSHCNLRCVFCQNHEISQEGKGEEVTEERLAEIFLEQQARGAATLDLVTPTHYVPQILTALALAKEKGFSLPVVYNSNGYENPEILEKLRGFVQVFLPDFKYFAAETAVKYSAAPAYPEIAKSAVRKMAEVAGPPVIKDGVMQSGVLVRHLVLPGRRHESMAIVKWLYENFGSKIYLSLMNQYTPLYRAAEYKEINRRLTTFEYESVVSYGADLGLEQCFVQERGTATQDYVPSFDGSNVQRK